MTSRDDLERRVQEAVEWRPKLWAPVVRRLIGDPQHWEGRSVLELGPRRGLMSVLFGELGATVHGLDISGEFLDEGRAEAARRGVSDRVTFSTYDGTPEALPDVEFDTIFCKSVLVVVPDRLRFLSALEGCLAPEGELLAAENAASGRAVGFVRRNLIHRTWDFDKFSGADEKFVHDIRSVFSSVEHFRRLGLVVGVRARKRAD